MLAGRSAPGGTGTPLAGQTGSFRVARLEWSKWLCALPSFVCGVAIQHIGAGDGSG